MDTVVLAVNEKLAEVLQKDMKQHEKRIGVKVKLVKYTSNVNFVLFLDPIFSGYSPLI